MGSVYTVLSGKFFFDALKKSKVESFSTEKLFLRNFMYNGTASFRLWQHSFSRKALVNRCVHRCQEKRHDISLSTFASGKTTCFRRWVVSTLFTDDNDSPKQFHHKAYFFAFSCVS